MSSIQFTTVNFDVLFKYKYKSNFLHISLAIIPEECQIKAFLSKIAFFKATHLQKSYGITKTKMNPASVKAIL